MGDDLAGVEAANGTDGGAIGGLLTIDALDKRTRPYKRFSGVLDALYSDLGGEAHLTEVKKQLVNRLATLAVWCEAQDALALSGGEINPDLYGRVAGHMRRIAETLGVERVARDITQDLQTYLAGKRIQEASKASPSGSAIDGEPSS